MLVCFGTLLSILAIPATTSTYLDCPPQGVMCAPLNYLADHHCYIHVQAVLYITRWGFYLLPAPTCGCAHRLLFLAGHVLGGHTPTENDRNVRGGEGYVVISASVVATDWER